MGLDDLAKAFGGIVASPEPVIRTEYESDMADDTVFSAEEKGMIKSLPKGGVGRFFWMMYRGGWQSCEDAYAAGEWQEVPDRKGFAEKILSEPDKVRLRALSMEVQKAIGRYFWRLYLAGWTAKSLHQKTREGK